MPEERTVTFAAFIAYFFKIIAYIFRGVAHFSEH